MAYIKKTVAEIANTIKINMVTNVDGINDANIGSVLDQFTTAFSEELEAQYNDLDTIYNSTRISTATGTDLEELGSLLGTDRDSGSTSSGVVTFVRNSPANTDFIISSGAIVSTQPGTDITDYKFTTDTTTTFYASLIDETQVFVNGIYEYKANQRFIDSISEITGTVSAAPNTFTQNTDYTLVQGYTDIIVDIDSYELVDNCETADWTQADEADAETLNASVYYQGSNALNLLKAGTTTTLMSYSKVLGSTVDLSSKSTFFEIYINAQGTLDKISSIVGIIGSGSSITNSYSKTFNNIDLQVGWNKVYIDLNSNNINQGTPDSGNLDYLKIIINIVNISDTFTSGQLVMDHWFGAEYDNSGTKDIIQFDKTQTLPDTSTNISTDYIPLSVDINVTADTVGLDFNVQTGKIIYKITNISNIDRIYNYSAFIGGDDIETDTEYKVRIQSASDLENTATVSAIKANVEALSYVGSVSIEDIPETTATEEVITYNTGTDKYSLINQVAIDDVNLTIGNTTGASDYTKDTDFELTINNEIDWSIGGTNPVDTNLFYTNYHYNKLGHFNVTVVGHTGALTATQLTEVTTTVDSLKSAGIIATVIEPSYVSVSVTEALTIDTNYDSTTVKENVDLAIQSYIDNLGIGDDVLLAGVITASMGVSGVTNVSVTDIESGGASDFTITTTQSAINGTHTIS